MRNLKRFLRKAIERAGYHVIANSFFGYDPFADFKRLLADEPSPCVIDVGGFVGEFALALKKAVPNARVHSFEPDPDTYQRLVAGTRHLADVTPVNLALGSDTGELDFHCNVGPATSSFLSPSGTQVFPGHSADLECKTIRKVRVARLDDYAADHQIDRVDLLKTDTQGYELQVLRGADRLLTSGRVQIVFCEVLFEEFYRGQGYFHDIHQYLLQCGMKFAGLYAVGRAPTGELLWADALYLNTKNR